MTRAQFNETALLILTLGFVFAALPWQIWIMASSWSVEGFGGLTMAVNVVIQYFAFSFGRDLKKRALWIPASFNGVFSLTIVVLYLVIRFGPDATELL